MNNEYGADARERADEGYNPGLDGYRNGYKDGYEQGLADADKRNTPMRCEYKERDNAFLVKAYERKCPACGDIILVSPAALPYEKFCSACGQRIAEGAE